MSKIVKEKVNRRYFAPWRRITNWPLNIGRFFHGFKCDYQRAKYGVSSTDCWDLQEYLVHSMINGLKIYKEETVGHPGILTPEEWDNVLDHMIELLETVAMVDTYETMRLWKKYCKTNKESDKKAWLKAEEERDIYQEDCWIEFCDLLKEWGYHLWW